MIPGIIIGTILLILVIYVISVYNSLVNLRNKVKDSWSQIEILLKRRYDLIPNLVETVKGYSSHEKETLEAVIAARNSAVDAKTPEDEMKAAGEVTKTLGKLLAIAESYPDLKANQNFMDLQANLKETEDKISFSRQFYNDNVLSFKNKLEMFPTNIIANMFGFKAEKFFEASEEEKENVKVKF